MAGCCVQKLPAVLWIAARSAKAFPIERPEDQSEILGIYTTKGAAIDRCKRWGDMVHPVSLNEDLPEEPCLWPDIEFVQRATNGDLIRLIPLSELQGVQE